MISVAGAQDRGGGGLGDIHGKGCFHVGIVEGHSCDAHLDQVWVMKEVIQRRQGLMTWRHTPFRLSSRTMQDKGVHCIPLSMSPGLQVQVVVPFLGSS